MAFSTWSDLAVKIKNDYAAGKWRTKSYDFDGMRKEFVSPMEILKVLAEVEARAAEERQDGYCLRTSARAGDR